eukprot:Gregarina_sp_Poly_1__773@NODE_1185_length_4838_cov_96_099350_g815_i0_p3_GENE_NODE_1185_length_4838_cov_96_099350_g815_i0NODE_1185_length_4838_cov_96_099350_g815_i0_p3_ORF_typecomplete_len181_score22_24DUF4813/PF16072_5/0_02_NODE_1185_length_4838_cov_96_099350_g815_i07641306
MRCRSGMSCSSKSIALLGSRGAGRRMFIFAPDIAVPKYHGGNTALVSGTNTIPEAVAAVKRALGPRRKVPAFIGRDAEDRSFGSNAPAGSFTPAGSIAPAGSFTPAGSIVPAGSFTPAGSFVPAGPIVPASICSGSWADSGSAAGIRLGRWDDLEEAGFGSVCPASRILGRVLLIGSGKR